MDNDERPVEHTTIIENGGGGSGGIVAVVVLVIVVLGLLYVFRGELGLGSKATTINIPDKINVNVN